MNTIKTLILFVIFAILAGYVYFYEIKGGEEREKEEEIAQKIIDVEPDSVKKIEIRSLFYQFRFERYEDGWKILKPVETGGDKSTIDGLLNTFKNAKKVRQFSIEDGEQKDFGLVGRSILLIFEFNDGRRDSIFIGDETPIGSNVFVSRGDTTIYTIASYIKNNVTKNLFDWRDKSIAKVKESEVREFELKNTHGSFYFVRAGTEWQILKPRKTRADNSTVNAVLRKFENGKAKSVVSETFDNPGQFDLSRPGYQIDLFLGESKAHKSILLSKFKNNSSNVKDDSRPQVMSVDSLFIRDIDKTFFQFRNKKLAEFNKNWVDSIVVVQGDSIMHFVKDTSNTWLFANELKVKEWKMNSFLNSLNGLEAKAFLHENISSTTKYGLNKPERIIKCYGNADELLSLRLNSSKDMNIAYNPDAKVIADIEESKYNSFEVKIDDYIDKSTQLSEDDN